VPDPEDHVPTYQYACTACGHRFEAVQSFSDVSLTDCPECAGRLRKVFSSVGIVFKGSGFYRTDSRSGEKVGAESSGSGSGKEGSSDKDGSSAKNGGPAKDGGSSAAKETSTKSSDSGSTSSSGSSGSSAAKGTAKAAAS
jgi:putative FmdB family regulatory protein